MSFQVYGGFVENGGEIEPGDWFCDFKAVLDENMNDDFKRKIPIFGYMISKKSGFLINFLPKGETVHEIYIGM